MSERREPYTAGKPASDRAIVDRAAALLKEGLLTSLLAGHLMAEYRISPERAARLAAEALKKRSE